MEDLRGIPPNGRGMKTEWETHSTHLSLSFPLCVMDTTLLMRLLCSPNAPGTGPLTLLIRDSG